MQQPTEGQPILIILQPEWISDGPPGGGGGGIGNEKPPHGVSGRTIGGAGGTPEGVT